MNTLLGKRALFVPWALLDKNGGHTTEHGGLVTGTVTYVNDKHSYFTATYSFYGETFRESFKFSQIDKDVIIRGH